jgi:hypothetical protein
MNPIGHREFGGAVTAVPEWLTGHIAATQGPRLDLLGLQLLSYGFAVFVGFG